MKRKVFEEKNMKISDPPNGRNFYQNENCKILIVDNSRDFTGAYKSISLATAVLSDNINFTFCLPRNSKVYETSQEMRSTVTLPFFEIRRHAGAIFYLPLLLLNSFRLLAFIRKNRIDLVHVNDMYNMTGVVIKRMFPRLKVIYHVRLLPTSYSGKLYRVWRLLILKYADRIICVSEAVRNNFPEHPKVIVVNDAIDHIRSMPSASTKAADESINLLYLANYTPGKGHDHAIRAFASALQHNSSLRLLMAGGDLGLKKNQSYLKSLKELAARENVIDKMEFTGFVKDTSALLNRSDIFLNFSLSESFSMTCIEALAHGLPLIATDSGGPSELFVDGVSGILVPVGDIEAMTRAILKTSSDSLLRERLGEKGREHVLRNFNVCKSAQQLKQIYFDVLHN